MCGACATLLRGSRQTLNFRTDPPDAQVSIDGRVYTSPVRLSLRRKVEHHVVVQKAGYRTVVFNIRPEWDGISLIGNIIMPGGSIGIVADKVSGADMFFYKLAPIDLSPTTHPAPPAVLYDYHGHLLTAEQIAKAEWLNRQDRSQFFRGEP